MPRVRRFVEPFVMVPILVWGLVLAACCGLSDAAAGAAAGLDPLPSWNEGPAKRAIIGFVHRVSDAASPDHVPAPERIAVFDNDGTLWPEYPLPFQAAFAVDRLRARAAADPKLQDDPMVKALLAGDLASLVAGDRHEGLLHVVALTHAGLTTDAFRAAVADWMATARHPRFGRPYDQLTYRPMQEVLALLRAHGFKTWIVSGGGVDFMRAWTERVYGIPPEQVIGSTGRPKYELRPEGPSLVKTLEHLFVDDKAGKPVGIHQFIGRRPIACFGNSDGDLAMLEYTTIGNPRPTLGVIVHHTDADREYAYDAQPKGTGKLVAALEEAPRRGWTVVDMRGDWRGIFADDAAAANAGQPGPRSVPARVLPVPSTVSPALAAVIAQPIQTRPAPRTADEWRSLQRTIDAERSERAKRTAATLGATVEEQAIAGVRCYVVTPREVDPANASRLLVHLHGGAFVLGSGFGAAQEAILMADAARTKAVSIDYRMPPDHPFPAAVDDAVGVWRELVETRDPRKMAIFGSSAGGGLTMAAVLKLKELAAPLPAAAFIGTPVSDITKTGDSYFANAEIDNVLGRYEGFLGDAFALYAGGADLRQPLLSPVYGDLSGFPPAVLISGTRDLFLSNTVRAHRALRAAGVPAELHVFEGQSHADYLKAAPSLESADALREVARFFDTHLAR
jgi:acetyl esterase/lipase/phosphoglycolate phosphatase-like HAD superfamily hydrolase